MFAVMNVITAVFCESAIASANSDEATTIERHLHSKKQYADTVRKLFACIDAHDTNSISYGQFQRYVNTEEAVAFFASLSIDVDDAWDLFRLIDSDKSNQIDVDEFVEGCIRLRGRATSLDLARLRDEMRRAHQKLLMFCEASFRRQVSPGDRQADAKPDDQMR